MWYDENREPNVHLKINMLNDVSHNDGWIQCLARAVDCGVHIVLRIPHCNSGQSYYIQAHVISQARYMVISMLCGADCSVAVV